MAIISVAQAQGLAQSAGFSGKGLQTVVAIAQAESGLNTSIAHPVNDQWGSIDRGILQINNHWHAEISDACAYDPACSFKAAFAISHGGTDFSEWTTFTTGAYTKFLSSSGGTPQTNTYSTYTGKPWYTYPIWKPFDQMEGGGVIAEHGVDLATPVDTPITAVFPGTITDISKPSWGWAITWKLDNPSMAHGAPYEYTLHLDAVEKSLQVGTHINSGTLLGWSGGANSAAQLGGSPYSLPPGYQHTLDSPDQSSGPHVEIGLYGGPVYGSGPGWTNLPNPAFDPTFMLGLASSEHLPFGTAVLGGSDGGLLGTITTGSPTPQVATSDLGFGFTSFSSTTAGNTSGYDRFSQQVHETLVQYPGFYGICLALDEAEQFPGIYSAYGPQDVLPWNLAQDTWQSIVGTVVGNTMPLVIRGGLVLVGALLFIGLMFQLMKPAMDILPELLMGGA